MDAPVKYAIGVIALTTYANGVVSLTADRLLTIAETALFVRQAGDVWTDAERAGFINFVAANPEEGDLIPDTGGLRKVRWSRQGSGKRGGVRVIYFFHDDEMPLYLLLIYAKSQRENFTPDEKHRMRVLVAAIKQANGRR